MNPSARDDDSTTTGPARNAERERLEQDARREQNWKRWGPYLSERQWGTVREDYSADGACWDYFPFDQSRSRAYRWGEDGLLGITDRQGRLCFGLALWNGRDPFLKERLFGLGGPEGNHGEDVKEEYFYLDAVPSYAWMKALYKYPQAEFPYARLREENKKRTFADPEFELRDTGVFEQDRYFDVFAEYAKAAVDDILVRIEVHNRAAEAAELHVLPQLWFRNTWGWGRTGEGYWSRPVIKADGERVMASEHASLGAFTLELDEVAGGEYRGAVFTGNETNNKRVFGGDNQTPFCKDAFHDLVVGNQLGAVNPAQRGTKAAFWCRFLVPACGSATLRLRLRAAAPQREPAFGAAFDAVFQKRLHEADAFYRTVDCELLPDTERAVQRQAYAGLLWSKQFYHFDVKAWLEGDPVKPPPPPERKSGRDAEWEHLYNRDVISMPDKWEYPWYAAWDLAFHMVAFARIDPQFAKDQLLLLLREWYMAPSGQIPAYEFAFGDVNPPVHAWACFRVYKIAAARGQRDQAFLKRAFHKLLLNFTWWVNRKDVLGKHIFSGGFLGLDNIGVFDRNKPLPGGGHLVQADGTAWMAFYCSTMLGIALELANADPVYEDVASKFFEHFVAITHAMNTMGGTGLWDEGDGFYYDQMQSDGRSERLKIRSMVGVIPLFAVEVLDEDLVGRLRGFDKRMRWFLEREEDLARHLVRGRRSDGKGRDLKQMLLAIPSQERLVRVLKYLLDENEFLSPFGVRSLSAVHRQQPFVLKLDGQEHRVDYSPGESSSGMFGGNSNWRGPVWWPVNFLLIEALERYGHFHGDRLKVECPVGSGRMLTLVEVADELSRRLCSLFLPGADGARPFAGGDARYASDPNWKDLMLFHEYFHGDTGRGCGASHQTGWTALVARLLEKLAHKRPALNEPAPAAGR